MTINVTQDHIDRAKVYYHDHTKPVSLHCPIALALQDATGKRCTTASQAAHIDGIRYELPRKASKFIMDFDYCNWDRLAPFSFELEIDE